MTILHKLDDLFEELFPELERDQEQIKEALKRYYTFGPFEPKVEVKEGIVHVNIDVERIEADKHKFDKLVSLAESGNYNDAVQLAQDLINEAPNISEYHRVLGQIYFEKGELEKAMNSLIDSLKWNPKNENALLMMGNVYSKHKDDVDSALTFYNQVLNISPDDHLALNNIGAILMQNNREHEAVQFFLKALEVNDQYPNTHLGLSLTYIQNGEYYKAFSHAINGIKASNDNNEVLKRLISSGLEAGRKVSGSDEIDKIIDSYKSKLESQSKRRIQIVEDDSIATTAKLEVAENYQRDEHTVKFKSNKEGYQHLLMHELVHLDFIVQARKRAVNKLFVSNADHKNNFLRKNAKAIEQLTKQGVPEEDASNFFKSMFDGLNNQLFNTPVDLFIENKLFNEYKELRPVQFVSLYQICLEGLNAVTNEKVVKLSPQSVLRPSKVLNMVMAHQFKDLFGINLLAEYDAVKYEEREAKALYEEWQDYKDDRQPGEEYEIIKHWGEDLKLDTYFDLIDEKSYRNQISSPDDILDKIEKDPYGISTDADAKKEEMEKFLKTHSSDDINMAVAMYMIDALEHFNNHPKEEVKQVAHEIALIGTQGIDPKKKSYRVKSVPGKTFTGYHLLAYYYVSWAIAIPDMLNKLGLPFDEEFKLAKQFYNQSEK